MNIGIPMRRSGWRTWTCLVLLCLQSAASFANPASDYAELVAKANQDPGTADFAALRKAYALTDDYDPYGMATNALMDAGMSAYSGKDCKTALEKLQAAIALNFTIADAHIVSAACLKENGDQAGSTRESTIAHGLLDSVLASGDGKTADTAFHVTHIYEERLILLSAGLREKGQALLSSKDGPVDQITAVSENGERTFFFNVAPLLEGTARRLKAAPAKQNSH